ncbi:MULTISPECIES: ABC transporter permease subunit [Cellulomonas]|uniref:ABC transporter permease subunit n=1 Tax=Cellulomonas TaxID=1707 RepID=UPI0010A7A86E|nr:MULTISPECIES: ABC transporter permease subunit [Cellulomonas]
MIRGALLRVRFSRAARVVAVVAGVVLVGQALLLVTLPLLVDALIGLNDVVPNATEADRMTAEQRAQLGLDQVGVQLAAADLTGGAGTGLAVGAVLAAVVAALVVGNEFRRGSVVASFLAEPRRGRVVGASLVGLVVPVVAAGAVLAVARGLVLLLGARLQGVGLRLGAAELAGVWVRGVVALVLVTAAAAGLAFLVRSAGVAIGVVAGVAVLESSVRPLLALLVDGVTVADALPFGLVTDAVALPAAGPQVLPEGALPPGTALGILLAWAVVLVGAAWWRTERTDVPVRG